MVWKGLERGMLLTRAFWRAIVNDTQPWSASQRGPLFTRFVLLIDIPEFTHSGYQQLFHRKTKLAQQEEHCDAGDCYQGAEDFLEGDSLVVYDGVGHYDEYRGQCHECGCYSGLGVLNRHQR